MWRQAVAINTRQPDSPFGIAYGELDTALSRQTCKLLESLQALGLVQRNIDAEAVGKMIFNNANMMFTIFVKKEEMTVTELLAQIRRQNRTLVAAIAM